VADELLSQVDPGHTEVVKLTAAQAAQLRRIRKELAALGPCLPGSINIRQGRCGKPHCSCRADPPRLHGPFRSWTRKLAGKTVTRLLSQEQLDDYQPWFDNHRRLKDLVRQIEQLSLDIAEADTRWTTN